MEGVRAEMEMEDVEGVEDVEDDFLKNVYIFLWSLLIFQWKGNSLKYTSKSRKQGAIESLAKKMESCLPFGLSDLMISSFNCGKN